MEAAGMECALFITVAAGRNRLQGLKVPPERSQNSTATIGGPSLQETIQWGCRFMLDTRQSKTTVTKREHALALTKKSPST